jgi:hypothetical protein
MMRLPVVELTRLAEMLMDNACPRWMVEDRKMPHMHACMYLFNTPSVSKYKMF